MHGNCKIPLQAVVPGTQKIQYLTKNEKNPLGFQEHFPAIIGDQTTEVYLLRSTSSPLGNTYPLSDVQKEKLPFIITVLIRYLQFCNLPCIYSNRSRSHSSMINPSSSSNQAPAPSSPLRLFFSDSFLGKFQTSTESLSFLVCQPHINTLGLFKLSLNPLFQGLTCLS